MQGKKGEEVTKGGGREGGKKRKARVERRKIGSVEVRWEVREG